MTTILQSYDAASNLTGVSDPLNNGTSYNYDAANRLTQDTDPFSRSTFYVS